MSAGRGVALALLVAAAFMAAPRARAAMVVEANLSAGQIEVGSSVSLTITVSDPVGGVDPPSFALPPGLAQLASEQAQSMSWVNGRASNHIQWRYDIGAQQVGRYMIGPFRVVNRNQIFEVPAKLLVVTPASARPAPQEVPRRARSEVGAALSVETSPKRPYAGQLVQLALRLAQTQSLTASGGNGTPSTTGFWAESYGDPIEYRSSLGGRPAVVTERRCRIYPLAPGRATIGSAGILVTVADPNADPFFGGGPATPVEIRSESVHVEVEPLPPGAPAGFANAVGSFQWSWGLDRGHATQDQALALHLDVRGVGNLPLLRTPPLDLPDFDIFPGTVEDSLAPPGELSPGRRRFQWTLSPRRTGTLHVAAPPVAWFDPGARAYRSATLPPLEVEVLAASGAIGNDADAAVMPEVFGTHEAHPGSRPAEPWLLALGGVLLGLAVRLWRRPGAPDARAAERAEQARLHVALERAHGAEFARGADAAVAWAGERGAQVLRLREEIAAARYGGTALNEDEVRKRVLERLAEVLPPARPGAPFKLVAAGLVLLSLAAWFVGHGSGGSDALAERARSADALAHAQRLDEAAAVWAQLWQEAPGDPALAARLGWASLRHERVAEASAWVLRGLAGEPRSAPLAWTSARVREGGGLVGAPGAGLPLRALECGALAFALALGALLEWPRRWSSALLLALALALAAVPLVRHLRTEHAALAVVRTGIALGGGDVDLQAGEVVRVLARHGDRVRVAAGRDLEGELPASALLDVRTERP